METSQLESLFKTAIQFKGNYAHINAISEFANQNQTNDSFSEKWVKLDAESSTSSFEKFQKDWVLQLYGFDSESSFADFLKNKRIIIDAGCGLGYKAAWMAELAPHAIVFGADYSEAAQVASRRYAHLKNLYFVRADIANLPFKSGSLDFILCDQVIHHTEDPKKTYFHLAELLSDKGSLACYVYAKKALPRELMDDYFRKATHSFSHQEMWAFSDQLTELGKRLSELKVSFDCPDIPALGIKGGNYDIQRFIYWNFLKCFYHPNWTKSENDSCNFDWYSPSNAERYTPDQFRQWSLEAKLKVDFFRSEEAAHTSIASK
jgi:SAM-dependent methyltransferase